MTAFLRAIPLFFFVLAALKTGAQAPAPTRYFRYETDYQRSWIRWLVQLEHDRVLMHRISVISEEGSRGFWLYKTDTLLLRPDGSFGNDRMRLSCSGEACVIDQPGMGRYAHQTLKPVPKPLANSELNNGRLHQLDQVYNDSLSSRYRRYYTAGYWKPWNGWDTMKNKSVPHEAFRRELDARLHMVLDNMRQLLDSFTLVTTRTVGGLARLDYGSFTDALSKVPQDSWQYRYYSGMLREAILQRPEFALRLVAEAPRNAEMICLFLKYNQQAIKPLEAVPGYAAAKRALGLAAGD